MALAIIAIFGPGTIQVIIAITLPFGSPLRACRPLQRFGGARDALCRRRALNRLAHARIIMRHIAPNVVAPFLIMLTAFLGEAILLEASLSYLGLGVQEPTPAWGLMLRGGAEEYAESAPWVPIWPGLAITVAVFGFNLFGDAVRDILDPRLRSSR